MNRDETPMIPRDVDYGPCHWAVVDGVLQVYRGRVRVVDLHLTKAQAMTMGADLIKDAMRR